MSSNFVKEDILKYDSKFSWTNVNWTSRSLWRKREIKIGSCDVRWNLNVVSCGRNAVKIGFYGENLGLHTGVLSFEVERNIFNCYGDPVSITEDRSIRITKDVKNMKYVKLLTEDLNVFENVFSGTITVFDCDCLPKPYKAELLKRNFLQLQSDICTAWKDKLFTDVDIKVDNTCFPVHKFVLGSRSPVFAKMLEYNMKEKKENCIYVAGTNEKIMKDFLSFLYSGSLEDDSFNTVIGLYSLADKYQVTSLQQSCRSILISKMEENTVLEILKVADSHSDEGLKQKSAQFISGRFSKIEINPEWSTLIDSNTRLASYVLRFVSQKRSAD